MRIRMLKSVKDSSGWIEPGAIRDFDDEEARRLIRLRAADPVPPPSEDSEEEEIPIEDLQEMVDKLLEIDGVNTDLAHRLIESGYKTVQSVAEAEPEDLIKIKGIGPRSVEGIQESAEDLLEPED